MNVVVLSGNLARDPDVRYGANQLAIAKFTVAVNRPRRNGEDQPADFIRVTAFGKQAELVERYLSKGRKVGVEGRIQTGSYEDKDGKTVYTTDVIASRVEFLDSKRDGGAGDSYGGGGAKSGDFGGQFNGPGSGSQNAPKSAPASELPSGFTTLDDDDDLPF